MIRIKVCIIGDFSCDYDEGLKNIAHSLANSIERDGTVAVLRADIKVLSNLVFPSAIREFNPDIIHYVPGPTNKSLLLLKYLKTILGGKARIVLSSPHPMFSDRVYRLLALRADHVLCSSESLRVRLNGLGVPTTLLSNGVNLTRFRPLDKRAVVEVRKRLGLPGDRPIVLHVGHLTQRRNLSVFEEIGDRLQVVIVASQYLKSDRAVEQRLKNAGCKIVSGYQPRVEEFYQISNCYVFPVKKENTIAAPLSVLEGMACNLKIVTTKCDGLVSFFQQGHGLMYADSTEEIIQSIFKSIESDSEAATREKVMHHSWEEVSRKAISVYESLRDR